MVRYAPLALFLTLAACDSPSPQMRGAQPLALHVAGHDMTLWRAGDRVELIRHGYANRRAQAGLRPAMAQAIVTATGCALRPNTLEGDTGVLRATLNCP